MYKKKLSVIIPVHNEEANIEEVYYQINSLFLSLNLTYEIIFVDDYSEDKTYFILRDIQIQDINVKIIRLTKHYGQLYAFLDGFRSARGEIVITMDGDLQNDPRDIPKFLKKIEEGYDLVSGWRCNRDDPLGRKLISKISNLLIRKKTGVALHDYGCAFTAIKKGLLNKLKDYGMDARFIKPLLVTLADSVAEIKINHCPRNKGVSKYNLVKLIKYGLDFLINFTPKPKKTNEEFCLL